MKLTKRKLTIILLVLVLLLAFSAFIGIKSLTASAIKNVEVSGTSVFNSTGARVIAHKETVKNEENEDVDEFYTMFSFANDDDVISFRKNLAYRWFEAESEENPTVGEEKLFSMEIGFESTSFERFVITFESQEYNKSKEGKAVNYVMFFPAGDSTVYALITDDKEATAEDIESKVEILADHITIEFTEKKDGAYLVSVHTASSGVDGEFKSVKGDYSKYSSSSTSPVYPLIFNAEFEDKSDDAENQANMVLYSLNGQDFKLVNDGSSDAVKYDERNEEYYGGKVTDTKPAVLCLNKDLRYFELGSELKIDYQPIDVLRSSPTSTLNYYVLTVDQYKDTEADYNDTELFAEAKDEILLVSDYDKYLPADSSVNLGSAFNYYNEEDGKLTVDMLVKIYVHLKDVSSDSIETDVYLDWYIPEEYKVNLSKGEQNAAFIAVAKDELGVTYNYDNENKDGWSDDSEGIVANYQKKVDEAAKNLSAGSSSYIYLPSAEELFKDNASAYTDLKFSVYYYHDSKQSNTSLSSNNLSINITRQGKYVFTIYATDAAGNNMYYLDKDGEVKEFKTSDIWNMFDDRDDEDGLYNKLPWFTFKVSYTGVAFEETPGLQSTAYVGTTYTSASFKINGVSGSYTTNYRLFLFDSEGYAKANNGKNFTYEEFVDKMDELFNNADTRIYFNEIPQVSEADEDYEKYKDYEWSNSSTNFTPQDANAFYYIRAEVTDTQYNLDPVTCGLAVIASENALTLKGEDTWVQDNVASIVLLSVAGLAFIGIILLIVIKPKDKNELGVDFDKSRKKEKKSK